MNKLSDVEIYIWSYLEKNKLDVVKQTIYEVADKIHVSPSSIIRTLKKKNYSGFSEYKSSLKYRPAYEKMVYGLSEKANNIINEGIEELTQTIALLDGKMLESLFLNIHQANSIVILSRGLSVRIADSLARELQYLGLSVVSLFLEMMEDYVKRLPQDTLVIAISLSGETELILNTVKKARYGHKKILSITGNVKSELAFLSDYTLLAYQKVSDQNEGVIDYNNLFSIEFMTHLLVKLYALNLEEGTIVEK